MYADERMDQAARQVFALLRMAFTAAPILFGADKFFNWSVHWPRYLAPWLDDLLPGSAQQLMYAVGVVEIVAGLVVAMLPRVGAPLVAAWLGGIVVNLLTNDPPTYYDIALRASARSSSSARPAERSSARRHAMSRGAGRETVESCGTLRP